MVIRVDVVDAALQAVYGSDTDAMLAAPPGGRADARRPAASTTTLVERAGRSSSALTLLCGRYEGIDERVREHLANDAISVGPYVLSGGELAAMVVADAVLRKLPGALGSERQRGRGVVLRGPGGRAGVPALHPAGLLPGLGGAGGAAVRAPRADPALAAAGGRRAPSGGEP